MKLAHVLLSLSSAAAASKKTPQRLSHSSLSNDDNQNILLSALSRDGLVSISISPEFTSLKHRLMSRFTSCILSNDGDFPAVAFDDGTIRRSYAAITSLSSEENLHRLSSSNHNPSCEAFGQTLHSFQSAVDSAVESFAIRLSKELGSYLQQPLLTGKEDGVVWNDVDDVVSDGVILDHFHSYQKELQDGDGDKTIEYHVDQGLFLAFTPGLMVHTEDGVVGVSEGFYVKDESGEEHELVFDESDDLVFMLGDGVNHVINNNLKDDSSIKSLFATPHALKLKTHQDTFLSRAWFGRMVIPPQDALVPLSSSNMDNDHPTTFGQVRNNMIQHFASSNEPMLGIGCSSPNQELGLHGASVARDLQECAEDELFCWFKCMPLADHDLTTTTCSERNLQLQCTNPRDQVVPDGMMHGDYYPACTNSTDPPTDYPLIEQQDNLTCPDLWDEYVSTDDDYDHVVDVTVPNGPQTKLMWSILDGDIVKARLVHDNVFGWLAMGFADPEGGHNGMNGGQILLATPYSSENYSPVTGLDNSTEAAIATYVIDANDTAFRHWQEPMDTDEALATVASFDTNDCSTSISFESTHINGKQFNVNGTDEMIWAGNSNDYFVGYHGPFSRLRFTVDWQSGVVTPFSASTDEESHVEGSGDTASTVDINDILSDIESEASEEDAAAGVGSSAATCSGVAIWIVFAALTALVNVVV